MNGEDSIKPRAFGTRVARAFRAPLAFALLAFTLPLQAFDIDAVKDSVPRIILQMGEKNAITGSGFVVHAENDYCIVVTNHHVVAKRDQAQNLLVMRKVKGGVEVHEAEVIWEDVEYDMALLKVPGLKAAPLTLATLEPKQAEDVYAIGYPGMADNQVAVRSLFEFLKDAHNGVTSDPDGTVTQFAEVSVSKGGVRRVVTGYWSNPTLPIRIIEHDASIAHGNSGGPLFDSNGHIVGINTKIEEQSASKINVSSFIGYLESALEKQGISFLKSDEKVASAPMGAVGGSNRLVYICLLVAAIALLVAMRKRQSMIESYSHYVKRSGTPVARAAGADAPNTPAQAFAPALNVAAPKPARPLCILDGDNPEDKTHLRFIISDKLVAEAKERIMVGRSRGEGRLCIRNTSVSGDHLALHFRDGRVQVEDRDSSNGTRINGKKLPPYALVPIADGDRLEVGDVVLNFQAVT